MAEIDRPRCDRCMFAHPEKVGDDGVELQCRYNAPTLRPSGAALWPVMRPDDWCGDHRMLIAIDEQPDLPALQRIYGGEKPQED